MSGWLRLWNSFSLRRKNCRPAADWEHGSISIGASETALNVYLLEKLRSFHMDYPEIRLKIYNHSTPQAVQAVKKGEIDFAVVTTPAEVKPPMREMELCTFQEILVGGRTFAALAGQELSLAEIQNYPFICLGQETQTWKFYQEIFERQGLELRPDTEVATMDQILPLVKNELGLAFCRNPWPGRPLRKGRS